MKKFPPYSKPLSELQKQSLRPESHIFLLIGHKAWNEGKTRSINNPATTLVLPPWESAIAFKWPVKECTVTIQETSFIDQEYIDEIVYSLYRDGASMVYHITLDTDVHAYKKD